MKRKIFSKMVLVSFAAVLITTVILSFIAYFQYIHQIESGIRDEAGYMATSLNLHDKQDLNAYKDITISRITWVDTSGNVIMTAQEKKTAWKITKIGKKSKTRSKRVQGKIQGFQAR